MFQKAFEDSWVLNTCIEMFNNYIDKYEAVNLEFANLIIGLGRDEKTRFTDSRIGWTEKISASKDVQPKIRGNKWVLVLTLPEPKEL